MYDITSIQKQKNWFNKNFVAVPRGVAGDCDMCFFHGHGKYCLNTGCWCFDNNYIIRSFFWRSCSKDKNVFEWPELDNFFNSVAKDTVKEITLAVMKNTISKQQHGK